MLKFTKTVADEITAKGYWTYLKNNGVVITDAPAEVITSVVEDYYVNYIPNEPGIPANFNTFSLRF